MDAALHGLLTPAPGIAGVRPYHVPRPAGPIDLHLDGNEGASPPRSLLAGLAGADLEILRRYPDAAPLEARLAERLGVTAAQVIATAGADDALDRLCRALLTPGRQIILPQPTFEMIARYARICGADIVAVPWSGPAYPTAEVRAAMGPRTALIAVVSPNNPTGAVASAQDLRALAGAAPHAVVVLDHAYVEFADDDLTAEALRLPNVVVVRTLSKAWGVAGLRVGYAAGPAEVIGWLRAAGAPYAVSGLSLALAAARLASGAAEVTAFVAQVRAERHALEALLQGRAAQVIPSQANFVFARFPDALRVRDALGARGIAVRAFPDRPGLEDALRITCPGSQAAFARLCAALQEVLP